MRDLSCVQQAIYLERGGGGGAAGSLMCVLTLHLHVNKKSGDGC